MRPHPRIRKVVKWGGAVMTVLLVGVWVGSGWSFLEWDGDETQVQIAGGQLAVNQFPGQNQIGMGWDWDQTDGASAGIRWGFKYTNDPAHQEIRFPLWPLVVVLTCTTAAAWRLDTLARRRARLNLCPKCNYDRTGLAAGAVCPECGAASS